MKRNKAKPLGTKADFFSEETLKMPKPTRFMAVKLCGMNTIPIPVIKATLEARLNIQRRQYALVSKNETAILLLVNECLLEKNNSILHCSRVSVCHEADIIADQEAWLKGTKAILNCKKIHNRPIHIACGLITKAIGNKDLDRLKLVTYDNPKQVVVVEKEKLDSASDQVKN